MADAEVPAAASDPAPSPFRNRLSIVGAIAAVWGFTGLVFFFLLDFVPGESHAYAAMSLAPSAAVLAVGIAVCALGALLEARRRRRGASPSLPHALSVELGKRFAVVLVAGTAIVSLVMMSAGTGASRLYEVTESNTFCGTACHTVMEPEWVAFQDSPHSRVECVDCHIGENVESYVSYKLNGLRQVALVVTDGFERPVPTPIDNLRPAREICERCHWPERFIGYRDITRSYYLGDEENNPWKVRMLMKIGGGGNHGLTEGAGIHYHMISASRVEFVASDRKRQQIPWVRVTHEDGSVVEYEDSFEALDEEDRRGLEMRTMDCLDCHNRPAHRFESPVDAVNKAIALGAISSELPYVKVRSVEVLDAGYESGEEALEAIRSEMVEFYETEYPEIVEEEGELLDHSIATVQQIYSRNFFPEMRTDWRAHPDNIGHRDSPGCFRCHNDRMESEDGESLELECRTCHVILAQGEDVDSIQKMDGEGLAFFHPDDQDYLDEYSDCSDCHSGGADLYE